MKPVTDEDILGFGPFDWDFGDGERLLSDKMVVAAKKHGDSCHDCAGDIEKGERHRARVEAVDGEVRTYRWCALCAFAQGLSFQDEGTYTEARCGLGQQRRRRLEARVI